MINASSYLQGFASGDLERDATAVRMFTDAGVELILSQVRALLFIYAVIVQYRLAPGLLSVAVAIRHVSLLRASLCPIGLPVCICQSQSVTWCCLLAKPQYEVITANAAELCQEHGPVR